MLLSNNNSKFPNKLYHRARELRLVEMHHNNLADKLKWLRNKVKKSSNKVIMKDNQFSNQM